MDSLTDLDMFARGIGVGAMVVTAFGVLDKGLSRSVQAASLLICLGVVSWMINESPALWMATGRFYVLNVGAFAVGGFFWLFVLTVFEDRRISLANLSPSLVLIASGLLTDRLPHPAHDWLWAARNILSAVLCLHAAAIIARGWTNDLMEARRRLRGVVMGVAALFGVLNVVLAFVARLDPTGPWPQFTAGRIYGGMLLTVVVVAMGAVFLQGRPALLGPTRRVSPVLNGRSDAADRQTLAKLNELMAGGGWRQEGLTIGGLARQLDEPEHRLRRLINQRLGHRNFADFLNGYRIEAAKQRLADPSEARTTVAAIAFDLGYGSLGPFNRAFRAATGATPSEWRREALAAPQQLPEAV